MNLMVLGLSHKTAPVEQREKASLSEPEARAVLRELRGAPGVSEVVALSTCNRTELYAAGEDPARVEDALEAALLAHTHMTADELACARYVLRDERAAAQLFRVASGLDSMVVGESEIQGQVRGAWERAREEHSAGAMLNQLFRQALEVGKQVRSSTRIGSGSASVSAVAVDLAEDVLGGLPERRVLVIGAGRMAEATARALVQRGVGEVAVANRTVTTARDLAAAVGGRGVGFDRLEAELVAADIVITSTDAPHPILRRDGVAQAMRARDGRTMVIIDIAVPRDVEAAVAGLEGVVLHDIDDLEQVVEANLNGRRLEAERGEGYVIGAVQGFSAWRRGLSAAPAISSLREMAERIRQAELSRVDHQWESVSDADRERIDALTRGIVNKLLHEPTVRVRAAARSGDDEGLTHVESLRHLFGLEGPLGPDGDAGLARD